MYLGVGFYKLNWIFCILGTGSFLRIKQVYESDFFLLQNECKNIHTFYILCGMTDHQGQVILTMTESREPKSRSSINFPMLILSDWTSQWCWGVFPTPSSWNIMGQQIGHRDVFRGFLDRHCPPAPGATPP